MHPIVTLICATALSLLLPMAAHAGRSCDGQRPSTISVERGLRLAERTLNALESSGSEVVILARAGQDLSKYHIRYSHLGFAYRQADNQGCVVWRVVHKLNHCGTAEAALYRQGLGEFFLDNPWRYEAAFVVPLPAAQKQLLPILQNNMMAAALHERRYSMVSYAWGRRYQQSNQWAIETFAGTHTASANRGQAQHWLRMNGYVPQIITIDALSRLAGRITAANVAFDDHPPGQRFSDRIETVTVDSVFSWLERSGLGGPAVVVRE
jgi:hypothetical protein